MPDSLYSIEDAPARVSPRGARPVATSIFVRDPTEATSVEHLIMRDPRDAVLEFRETDIEDALRDRADRDRQIDALPLATLICLPAGADTPVDLQNRAEAWMASRGDERGAPYEVIYRSHRVLWRRGRALCIGTGEFVADVRHAIAYFSYCERELANLEQRMALLWPAVGGDLPLTHSVARRQLARQREVDARTREAHSMRLDFIRLGIALERSERVLSSPSRRVASELVLQADTADRLHLLDDGIEFAQETYDTANDRLLEYRYFRAEYGIEIVIAIILLVELVAVCAEFLRS